MTICLNADINKNEYVYKKNTTQTKKPQGLSVKMKRWIIAHDCVV